MLRGLPGVAFETHMQIFATATGAFSASSKGYAHEGINSHDSFFCEFTKHGTNGIIETFLHFLG